MLRRRFLCTSFIKFEPEVTFACLGLTLLRSVSELQRFMHREIFGAPEKRVLQKYKKNNNTARSCKPLEKCKCEDEFGVSLKAALLKGTFKSS